MVSLRCSHASRKPPPGLVNPGDPGGSFHSRMTFVKEKVLEAFSNVLECPQSRDLFCFIPLSVETRLRGCPQIIFVSQKEGSQPKKVGASPLE